MTLRGSEEEDMCLSRRGMGELGWWFSGESRREEGVNIPFTLRFYSENYVTGLFVGLNSTLSVFSC